MSHHSSPAVLLTILVTAFGLALAPGCRADGPAPSQPAPPGVELRRSVFAGGCFWCLETAFEGRPGVHGVVSGYAGGDAGSASYKEVSSGLTGHYEVVEVSWDPATTNYDTLLEIFWTNVDPTDDGGQFCDRGPQYLSAIFASAEERDAATRSRDEAATRLGQEVVTPILRATTFHPAEDYHQDFWLKNPARYSSYRRGCGRDARLEELWGKRPKSSTNPAD